METRVVRRGRGWWGILSTRRSPLVSSPPELKKGDRARHMPGGKRVCQLRTLRIRTYVHASLYATARTRATRSGESIGEKRERERERERAAHSSISSSLILDYEPLRTLLFREPGDSESVGIYCDRNVSEICEGGWNRVRVDCTRELLLRERICPSIAVAISWHLLA